MTGITSLEYNLQRLKGAFPKVVEKLVNAGYQPWDDATNATRDQSFLIVFTKRIYLPDINEPDLAPKRAYSIRIRIFDYRKFEGLHSNFGLEFATTIDSAGPEQFDVRLGQNGHEIDIRKAERQIEKIFRGVGSPFYNG